MSNLADEYELSQYTEIEVLDKNDKVHIVKDIRDKSIWVKKEIDEHSLYAYNKIKGNADRNIACVRNVLCCEEKYYVIEEYINGIDLKHIVEKNGPMELTDVQNIMCQVCDGISCLHKNNVIHRDITPSNIMISVDGTIKLIDLGISRIRNNYKNKDTTIMGTVGYASPEQYGFNQTDITSDIYSCGVLMNFMLTGELPDVCMYKGKMDYILKGCMKMNPNARYESAEELKVMIKNYSPSKSKFLKLPGFRSNKLWKKAVSIIMYMVLLLVVFVLFMALAEGNVNDAFECIYVFTALGVPFLLMTDYVYYLEHIPFFANQNRRLRKIWGVVLGIVVYMMFLCLNKFYLHINLI
ncbi:MAG: serine/threonine-protein kinase [Clostridia bacterium]|nr:serine/threonine-protein kinase [Clostridia bacterium]